MRKGYIAGRILQDRSKHDGSIIVSESFSPKFIILLIISSLINQVNRKELNVSNIM